MNVTINGEVRELAGAPATVSALLKEMRYSFPLLIVRINGTLVERSGYETAPVKDGDEVEVYHLVSGG